MKKGKMNKSSKLVLSIIFDLLGMASYLIPALGETLDLVWAPIAGILMYNMYGGTTGILGGIFSTLEEASPGADLIPTFTLVWLYTYVWKKDTEKQEDVVTINVD